MAMLIQDLRNLRDMGEGQNLLEDPAMGTVVGFKQNACSVDLKIWTDRDKMLERLPILTAKTAHGVFLVINMISMPVGIIMARDYAN